MICFGLRILFLFFVVMVWFEGVGCFSGGGVDVEGGVIGGGWGGGIEGVVCWRMDLNSGGIL